jgi:hypothetical protein
VKSPVFLERQSYRRRRLQDMSRLTPVLGLFLFMVPLLGAQKFGSDLAALLVYFFLAWAVLIVLAMLIARALERQMADEQAEEREG